MRISFKLLPVFILVIFLSGCGLSSDVSCENPDIQIYLSGFDSSDVNEITVTTYRKDGTFTHPEKVQYYSLTATGKTDTIMIRRNHTIPNYVDPNYDYIVELPVLNRQYRIASITIGQGGHTPDTNHGCVNRSSWFVDGKYTQIDQYNRGASINPDIILSK